MNAQALSAVLDEIEERARKALAIGFPVRDVPRLVAALRHTYETWGPVMPQVRAIEEAKIVSILRGETVP